MKTSFITILSAFAATALAAPAALPSVGLQLINDQTGASGTVTIEANGVDRNINALFGQTPVSASGHVLASSAQLPGSIPKGVTCLFARSHQPLAVLSDRKTWTNLDGDVKKPVPTDLDDVTVNCKIL